MLLESPFFRLQEAVKLLDFYLVLILVHDNGSTLHRSGAQKRRYFGAFSGSRSCNTWAMMNFVLMMRADFLFLFFMQYSELVVLAKSHIVLRGRAVALNHSWDDWVGARLLLAGYLFFQRFHHFSVEIDSLCIRLVDCNIINNYEWIIVYKINASESTNLTEQINRFRIGDIGSITKVAFAEISKKIK